MKLTLRTVAALELPPGRSEIIAFDDDVPGFGLRIRAGGSRNWVFQYKLGTKHRRITLGSGKAIDPSKARETAKLMHAQVRLGRDPAGEKVDARERAVETFERVMRRFLAVRKLRMKPRSYAELERHLSVHAKPLHGRQLAKVDRRAVAEQLSRIAPESGAVAANRVRASLSSFFAWAVREGLVDLNPVIGTNRAEERGARDRVLTDDELREIWSATSGPDHHSVIVRLLMLTGQRREEIGALRWSEVDLKADVIRLPGERTKNHRRHEVPLYGEARALIDAQLRRTDVERNDRDLIFGEGAGGFQGWSRAKESLDRRIHESRRKAADQIGADSAKAEPMSPWRLHDLRRTCATIMADRLGVAPHIVEAVLNHVSGHKAGVAGVYNHARYESETRAALALWAGHICALVERGVTN